MTHKHAAFLLALFAGMQPAFAMDVYTDANAFIAQSDFVAAETRLQQHLDNNTGDERARHLLAKVQAWQGHYTQSATNYQQLLNNDPNNTDYMFGLSQIYFWQQQHEQALDLIRKARQINPDDKDSRLLEIQILIAINTPRSNDEALVLSQEAQQKFPASEWPLPPQPRNVTPVRDIEVEVGLSADSLTNNREPWRGLYVYAIDKRDERSLYATIETTQRFDLDDNQLSAGMTRRFANASAQIEFTYSPTGRVLAEWSGLALFNFDLIDKMSGIAGYKHSQYQSTENNTVPLGLELNLSPYRLFYLAYPSHVSGAGSATSHNLGLDYNYGAENYFGCSISDGNELEYDGINPAVLSDISGIRCYGRHWFKPKWALSYSIGHFEQGDFYNRNGILVGLRYNY